MTVGARVGKYLILREIGGGGMAQVFEAEDQTIGRKVALKVLAIPPAVPESEKSLLIERFQQEARAAGNLSHTNVVTLYEVGEENGAHFIAMELLEGSTLREMLQKQHRLPVDQALYILLQVARALDYAHRQGVIHRAVKPDNIVVTSEGLVKVTDFGIARAANDLLRTQKGVLLSSPAYLSPEQILGEPVDQRTDIFSLGVTAYELLTGRHPFDAPTATAVMHRIVTDKPDPASELPHSAQAILQRAMAKEREARPSSAGTLVEDLSTVYYGTAVVSPEARMTLPTTHREKERIPMSTHSIRPHRSFRPLWWAGILVLVLAVGGFMAWRLWTPRRNSLACESWTLARRRQAHLLSRLTSC